MKLVIVSYALELGLYHGNSFYIVFHQEVKPWLVFLSVPVSLSDALGWWVSSDVNQEEQFSAFKMYSSHTIKAGGNGVILNSNSKYSILVRPWETIIENSTRGAEFILLSITHNKYFNF